jgi:choline dehydrogenase-like flavoprotein
MGSSQGDLFDYIIVGGGTAGLAVASRLSEDVDVTVLVIEAGPDLSHDPMVLTPGLMIPMTGQEQYDWNFISAPQVRCDLTGVYLCHTAS